MATFDFGAHEAVFNFVRRLPPPALFAGYEVHAPVIVLPNAFEPALCRKLIEIYQAQGGEQSGFMEERGGKTVMSYGAHHKVRRDCILKDESLLQLIQRRVKGRIVPEVKKVHQFNATRMERYLVACYSAEEGGHFNSHRDNTTKGTAHRRFAVSINLNEDFDGGELSFPEYGPRSHKMPTGTAVVFSCSLLHNVSRVTRGQRYAFLPFLYDDEAAKIRAANNAHLGEGVGKYSG
jgi:predicted 2-oxoglutarate/Fe(II)-dependent dioxygenase YbiX